MEREARETAPGSEPAPGSTGTPAPEPVPGEEPAGTEQAIDIPAEEEIVIDDSGDEPSTPV